MLVQVLRVAFHLFIHRIRTPHCLQFIFSVQLSLVSSRRCLNAPGIAPPSRPLQPEEMWGASRHLRLETKPKCELSRDNSQILAFWSTCQTNQTNCKRNLFLIMGHANSKSLAFSLKVSSSD